MIGQAVYALLTASPAVTAIVGQRVFPAVSQTPTQPPYVTYQTVGGIAWGSMDGPTGLAQPRVQVDAYAETYAGARALAAAVCGALDGFRGVAGGVRVGGVSRPTAPIDLYEAETEPRLFRVSQDFLITHDEAPAGQDTEA